MAGRARAAIAQVTRVNLSLEGVALAVVAVCMIVLTIKWV